MRVFVTGGTGFIGAHVVRALLARGCRVRCLVRASSPGLVLEGLDVERVEVALSDTAGLRRAMEDCDGVQHLAGIFDPGPEGIRRMFEVHVQGTRAILEAARELGIHRVVLCSSSITVGFGPLHAPGSEETPIPDLDRLYPPGSALRAYHDSKSQAEALARDFAQGGMGAVIVNPDYVVGPWDVKPTSGAMILQMAARYVPFYPQGGKCFIDAGDCAEGHVLAMEKGRPGQRYLLGSENLSYRHYMGLIADVVGQIPPPLPLPRLATTALGMAGALFARMSPHQAAGFDRRVLDSMQEERYRDGSLARRELGVPHTPISQSVQVAWDWFLAHGYAKRSRLGSRF